MLYALCTCLWAAASLTWLVASFVTSRTHEMTENRLDLFVAAAHLVSGVVAGALAVMYAHLWFGGAA